MDGKFDSASQFFSTAAEWFAYSDDNDKSMDMVIAQAEVLARQATARAVSDNPSFGVAASLLEKPFKFFGLFLGRNGTDIALICVFRN